MRVTTVIKQLLGVTDHRVKTVSFAEDGMIVGVSPSWRRPRCGCCGRKGTVYDRRGRRRWRHLSLGRMRIYYEAEVRRVSCPTCGVKTEAVPWARHGSGFTRDLEELVAYLAQTTDKTAVTKLVGIAWRTVGAIVERVVAERLDPGRLDGLVAIGIDELSFKKRHNYVTIVVDHHKRRVVWVREGKDSETLGAFLDELGPERLARLELATIDMSAAYRKALEEKAPHVEIVFDRFHVQRLVSNALDEVRREMVRELDGAAAKAVKNTRYALLKNPWNLTTSQAQKLHELQHTNKRLFRAYLLKESLALALDYAYPKRAKEELRRWLAWASRSRLAPMVKVARTIREHFEGILGYVEYKFTNAISEGFNRRARMTATRAYGFHGSKPLISMLFLCCGGIQLNPPLP